MLEEIDLEDCRALNKNPPFRHAIDVDEAIDELAVALLPAMLAAAAAFTFTRHVFVPSLARRSLSRRRSLGVENENSSRKSEFEAALARALGERLDAPVIHITAAIENDLRDARLFGALGDLLADAFGRFDVRAGLQFLRATPFRARRRRRASRPSRRR